MARVLIREVKRLDREGKPLGLCLQFCPKLHLTLIIVSPTEAALVDGDVKFLIERMRIKGRSFSLA
jgi:hypothetical protein